jgi:hypothetical protein
MTARRDPASGPQCHPLGCSPHGHPATPARPTPPHAPPGTSVRFILSQINVTTRVAQLSEMSILNRSSLITFDAAIAEEPTLKQSARDLPDTAPRRSDNNGVHGRANVGSARESGHTGNSYIGVWCTSGNDPIRHSPLGKVMHHPLTYSNTPSPYME